MTVRREVDVTAHRGEAENGGPALCCAHQACSTCNGSNSGEDSRRFALRHRELVDADLETLAVHLKARRKPVRPRPRCDQESDVEALDEHREEFFGLGGAGGFPLVHDE